MSRPSALTSWRLTMVAGGIATAVAVGLIAGAAVGLLAAGVLVMVAGAFGAVGSV